ncbi:hypothetical protein [Haloarcula sp. 1CSR25-25]|uniref:DUF7344 domain-containing protein n=1 Tax=Haloarcula sp. 1CSR25-25 TaxID=2862545 RepID=UPI002895217C|nr:hypothetical protein [Haloarcula sp. 1CSR25-25]MDT3437894.1 hypothetical protein [Haloarcula sp. 1CSR25-25]
METATLEAEFEPETVDRILSVLAHKPNRGVLNYFRESSESLASLDELADYVATKETSSDLESPEQVAVYLHHAGLPKIADAGILDYDPRTKTVRSRDHPLLESSELLEVA